METNDKLCDPNVLSVLDKYVERMHNGIKKYGTTTMRNDVSFLGWLNHLQDELMDATIYIERLKSDEVKRLSKLDN